MGVPGWSPVPDENGHIDDAIPAANGMVARDFAPAIRGVMAAIRQQADVQGGGLVTTGSLNDYVVETGSNITELRPGIALTIRADRTNTDAATLVVDDHGPLPWVTAGGEALEAGRIVEGRFYVVLFDEAGQSWRLQAAGTTLSEIPGLAELQETVVESAEQVAANTATVTTAATQVAQNSTNAQTAASQAQTAAAAGRVVYETLAALNANLTPADGAQGEVLNDGTNNGLYAKSGATGVGFWVKKSDLTLTALDQRVTARTISSGEMVTNVSTLGIPANGATFVGGFGRLANGYSIPAGQTGANTYLTWFIPFTPDQITRLVGETIIINAVFDATANFMTEKPPNNVFPLYGQANRTPGGVVNIGALVRPVTQTGLKVNKQIFYTVTAVDTAIGVSLQITSASTANTHQITLAEITWWPASASVTKGTSLTDYLLDRRVDRLVRQGPFNTSAVYAQTLTVRADGSGNHTALDPAVDAAEKSEAAARALVDIGPGTFAATEIYPRSFTDMRGAGWDRTLLLNDQPDNTALASIDYNSALIVFGFCNFSGLTARTRNGRYAAHFDLNGANPDIVVTIEDCRFEHLGNAGARAWQAGNGGNPSAVWVSANGVGMGSASGQVWHWARCDFLSAERDGFSCHNNAAFTRPSVLRFDNCRFVSQSARGATYNGASLSLQSLGSRKYDVCEMNGCEMSGPIVLSPFPWLSIAAADQVANKVEWTVRGSGNTPVPFFTLDDGSRALRIDSSDTTDSGTLTVSGTGATALFGDVVSVRPGGGIAAAVYGTWDVGEHLVGPSYNQAITSLGYRLGDCTTVNKTLTVTRNGTPINIVFNQNHTAQSNATILTAINTALGANATASLFDVVATYYPEFADQEARLQNTSATAIRRNQGCAYSADRAVRLATSADAATLFAGVALEDIRPGDWGRVKTRGVVYVPRNLDRSDAAALAFGDTLGIGATPGRFVRAATIPLMTALNTVDAQWERKFAL